VVGQSGTHLLTLINEVLDLAKIEAGKLTLNPAPFAFDRLLADTCLAFRQPVQEKGLEFSCTFAPGLPAVINTDAGKLRQVLFNLLSNALKFTQRGRVVFKVTETAEGMIRFEVIDTGVGMGAEDLRDIFQAFHQAGRTAPAAEGTGLGLTISRHLVELLGGKLNVESALGHGSRFWFELMPVGATGSVALAETGKPARVAGFAGARRRLLLTDDEPTNRTVLRELLEPLGFDVEEASDGEQCLEMCQRNAPDAVLLDLRMGAVDGFEVARTLRRQHGAQFKIIAITASVFESDRQQALDAGCDDFLPKPFTEEQLLSTLGRVLALEWHYAAEKAQTLSACVNGTEPVAPPAEEIDAVLELSRRGDILGIKKRLATLAAVDQGRYAPFVGILEPFVAAYQMNRIRDTMLKFKENGNHHP
jgi:CheY-like chemotaxis protein